MHPKSRNTLIFLFAFLVSELWAHIFLNILATKVVFSQLRESGESPGAKRWSSTRNTEEGETCMKSPGAGNSPSCLARLRRWQDPSFRWEIGRTWKLNVSWPAKGLGFMSCPLALHGATRLGFQRSTGTFKHTNRVIVLLTELLKIFPSIYSLLLALSFFCQADQLTLWLFQRNIS